MTYTIDTSNKFSISWGSKGHARILQNVINLLNTNRYEIAYDRTLGIGTDWIDMPADQAAAVVSNQIIELISEREPRAEVKEVQYMGVDDNGTILLKVVVDI